MSQHILRARFGDRESWALHDGDRFLQPSPAAGFPVDLPEVMTKLWSERKSLELEWVPPPDEFLTPLPVARIFCPAVNFGLHGQEAKMERPSEPYFFLKFASSAIAHGQSVVLPPQVHQADYEGEIGIVVGKKGKHWTKKEAEEAIFGYTVVNDVSLRDYQFREAPRYGKNWVMGKAFDGSLPIGPWILPQDEAPDFNFLIETKVNGELLSYLSEVNTLGPGDVVTTGTPSGVAAHGDRRYLKAGDVVEIEVSRIGKLMHRIAVEGGPPEAPSETP